MEPAGSLDPSPESLLYPKPNLPISMFFSVA